MSIIANVFTPALLAVFAGLSLGFGVVLFAMSRRDGAGTIDIGSPLSWAEPVEVRLVLYLVLGAVCGTGALVARLLFGFLSVGVVPSWLLLVLVGLGFIGNLLFFYAAAGSLLQAALGTRGRPPFWFTRLLSPVDGVVMDIGDVLAGLLFRPAPPGRRRRRRRETYEYEDDLESELEAPPRPRPRRRREYIEDDEDDFEVVQPVRRRPRPVAAERHRATREPSWDDESGPESESGFCDSDDEPTSSRPRRGRNAAPRDLPRERLELALREYESALSPYQRDKLREMRSLVESMRQHA